MPKARTPIPVRLSAPAVEWLDKVAQATGSTRTEVIRACISVGQRSELTLITELGRTP